MATENTKSVQYTFFGKVHPERCNVSIAAIQGTIGKPGDALHGVLRYYISLSQVTATFVCDEPIVDIHTLKNHLEDSIRVAIDALGYTIACGYDFEVTQMIDSLGNQPTVFGVGVPVVEKAAAEAGISFKEIMDLYADARGTYLQRCLADLREAIRAPKDTGFFCYRAIESLRQFFLHEKGAGNEKASWELLRTELNVSRDDINVIKHIADPVRHGHGAGIMDEQRAKVFVMTWKIVNEFVKYGGRGYKK